MLGFSGLSREEYELKKVYLNDVEYLGTVVIESTADKPKLVMLHGFGVSSLCHYKLLKKLKEHFNIYLVCHYGMGYSYRPPQFVCNSKEQADEIMVGAIEKWRQKMQLEGFILIGSSYGGYIAGTYASLYPQHIKKLILATPLGTKFAPEGWSPDRMQYDTNCSETPPAFIQSYIRKTWGTKLPGDYFRKLGLMMATKIIHQLVKSGNRRLHLADEEIEAYTELQVQIQMREPVGERALFF